MVVCPCTAGTLSAIACGVSNNLIEQAVDVVLKEQQKMILVVRETPLSAIHIGEYAQVGAPGGGYYAGKPRVL